MGMRHRPVKHGEALQRRKSGREEFNKQVNDCRISAVKWKGVGKKDKGEEREREGERLPAASNDRFGRLKKRLRSKGRV